MNSAPDAQAIRTAVRARYAQVARTADGQFAYPTGPRGAGFLGYDASLLGSVAPDLLRSFCGVGNPFSLGCIEGSQAVLDVGCGTGFDLFVAQRLAGDECRVYGVDSTPEMVEAARRRLTASGLESAHVLPARGEALPFEDASFDLVISNGVLNLSPEKERCLREIHRVLRPGGRLQFADVVLREDLPRGLVGSLEAWST